MTTPNLDTIFEALGNQHRREIIYALSLQPHSITHLARLRGLSLPAIHKHIKILKNAGLVLDKKSGRTHFLTINRLALISLQEWLIQYQPYWGNDKETLENYEQYLKGGEKKK
jgi:DNA-binding transcriptional ArsR family regulator